MLCVSKGILINIEASKLQISVEIAFLTSFFIVISLRFILKLFSIGLIFKRSGDYYAILSSRLLILQLLDFENYRHSKEIRLFIKKII